MRVKLLALLEAQKEFKTCCFNDDDDDDNDDNDGDDNDEGGGCGHKGNQTIPTL